MAAENGPARRPAVLSDAALLVAGATALIFLVGFLHAQAYYGRLGISLGQLGLPLEHIMASSFPILLWPVLLFVLYPAFEAALLLFPGRMTSVVARLAPAASIGKPFGFLSAPGVAAIVAIGSGAYATIRLGDETQRLPFFRITVGDLALAAVAVLSVVPILLGQLRGGPSIWNPLFGKTHTGSLVLGALATVGLCMAGASGGLDAGSAQAWACVPLPVVEFEPPQGALDPNRTYWLVARGNGAFFVREAMLPGSVIEYRVVLENGVEVAKVRIQPAMRSC